MSNKILTIIVPTYNMERYLTECLSSLMVDTATLSKLEILVINDGSTDSSSNIAHQFESKYPESFKVIDKENGNYGSCVNVGLQYATGKYVKILDADDWCNSDNLKAFISFLECSNADMIISDYASYDSQCNQVQYFGYQFKGGLLSDYLNHDITLLQMHAVTYRTDKLRKIGYHQTEHLSYTDQEWLFLPMTTVNTIDRFDKLVYMYRVGREDQTMNPIVFEKNFWQEIEVAKHIALSYIDLNNQQLSIPQKEYLERKMIDRLSAVYYGYFKKFRNNKNTKVVAEFDKFVKKNLPEFYSVFDDYTWNEGRFFRKYHYIKAWRKHYGNLTPLLRLANLYSVFYKQFNHIKE